MMTARDETILGRRMLDLADQAWTRGIPRFTDFLDLNEQNIYHSIASRLDFIHCRLFGGYENAERQMLGFFPDAFCGSPESETALFPLTALSIRPLNERFAAEMSHRDYLGSLMNLGIRRDQLGDILTGEKETVLICSQQMGQYLAENLTRVRHTSVACHIRELTEQSWEPRMKQVRGFVASVRLDALLAAAFSGSRGFFTELIQGGMVFVNGRQVTKASWEPPDGAVISVRGQGRVRYDGTVGKTKKERQVVSLQLYL